MERCGDCRYWWSVTNGTGECRRYRPQIVAVVSGVWRDGDGQLDTETLALFPVLNQAQWCGEFEQVQGGGSRYGGDHD